MSIFRRDGISSTVGAWPVPLRPCAPSPSRTVLATVSNSWNPRSPLAWRKGRSTRPRPIGSRRTHWRLPQPGPSGEPRQAPTQLGARRREVNRETRLLRRRRNRRSRPAGVIAERRAAGGRRQGSQRLGSGRLHPSRRAPGHDRQRVEPRSGISTGVKTVPAIVGGA